MDTRLGRTGASTNSSDLSGVDFGVLEKALATLRARKAISLIPTSADGRRILDLGCGANLTFLSRADGFSTRVGADRPGRTPAMPGVHLLSIDFERTKFLPFRDESFSVVTMLAVLEHIKPDRIASLLAEAHRVLERDGVFVVTTPLAWTDSLLRWMARLRLLSRFHISDHERTYTRRQLTELFAESAFADGRIESGSFELGANGWIAARKT